MRSHLGMADVQGDVYYIDVRKDYIHKLTDEITRDYAEVVVPRPNFADVVERVDGSALVNDAAWGELVRQLDLE